MFARTRLPVIFAATLGVAVAIGLIAVLSVQVAFGDEDNDGLDDGSHLQSEAAISVDEAIAIAEGEASGPIDDIELEQGRDGLFYEIEVGETDVYVNAEDGSVLSVDEDLDGDDRWDDDDEIGPDVQPEISVEQAIEIAESEVDGTAHDVELEREHGTLVYSVEIGNQEVEIDATTGEILATEFDD